MTDTHGEMRAALNALRLEVSPAVADDVERKVRAEVESLASDLATAKAERDEAIRERDQLARVTGGDATRGLATIGIVDTTAYDRAESAEASLQTARERIEVCESALREIERACSVYVGTGAMADPPLDATMTARELAHNVLEGNGK